MFRVLLVGFSLAIACLPLLTLQLKLTWRRPYYEFLPFVLAGSVAILYARRQELGPLEPGRARVSYLMVVLAWLLLALAELLYSPWLGGVATLFLLATILYGVGGASLLRKALPAWAFLWLALPPPFRFDRAMIQLLQELATRWAGAAMDALGILHVVFGNVIEIGGRSLFIDEACSGVNSLFSVLACAVFFVCIARRKLLHAVLLAACAVAWVLVANVVRIVTVATLLVCWGIDVTSGWKHDALGFVLFVAALGFIWSTDRFFLLLALMLKRRS